MPKPAFVRFAIAVFAAALLFAACGVTSRGHHADPSAVSSPTPARTLASPSPPPAVSEAIPSRSDRGPVPGEHRSDHRNWLLGMRWPTSSLARVYQRPDVRAGRNAG